MQLVDLFLISLRTLAKNKLRSGLTVLGVVIGIAAVMTMVSIGQGAGLLVRAVSEPGFERHRRSPRPERCRRRPAILGGYPHGG